MDYNQISLEKHYQWKGKLEVLSKVPLNSAKDLSIAYTIGVARRCI